MNIYYNYKKPNIRQIHPEFPYYVSPIRKKLQEYNKNKLKKKKPFCEWINTYLFNKSKIKTTTIKTNTNNIILLNQSDSPSSNLSES
jgi:hypothetical protein